jgi:hypothetical protein
MIVRGVALAIAALLTAVPIEGQALRRVQAKAFPFSFTPFVAIGWGGTRATEDAPGVCTGPACIQHKVGSGPQVGVELQMPLAGTLGFGLTAVAGLPNRVFCDLQCVAPERLTAVHGAALILWRFKARAPIYFGIGPAISYLSPGPVTGQTSAVTEFGGSVVVAYEFRFSPRVGGRLGWWNYIVKPSEKQFATTTTAKNLTWDTQIGLGLRFALGS